MSDLDPAGLEAATFCARTHDAATSGAQVERIVRAYLAAVLPPDEENRLRTDVRPADDRYFVWVCPTHGIISEDELAEGVDWQNPNPDGDIYTDEFFCQRQHADDEDHRVQTFDLAPVLAAGRAAATPDPPDDEGWSPGVDDPEPPALGDIDTGEGWYQT